MDSPSFAADVFSLTAILLDIMSLILGHSMKTFASHRSKHNRSAGRGGAPADASFHKNLAQVGTWTESLQNQAKEKERAFRKSKPRGKAESLFYGSIFGILGVCKHGICKEPSHRFTARELEKETRQWVDRGLGTGRRWCCGAEAEEVIPGVTFAPVVSAATEDVESEASFDLELPIERPTSLAPSISVDGTSVINHVEEDVSTLQAQEIYLPEADNDWPLRRDPKAYDECHGPLIRSRYSGKAPRRPPRPVGGLFELS